MISRTYLLKVINTLYFVLSKKLFKSAGLNISSLLKNFSVENKKRVRFFLSRILFNRNKHFIKICFDNYLLLFFFREKHNKLKNFGLFRLFYVWNVFNIYIENIPNIKQLKLFFLSKLIMKKNKFTLKFIFLHYFKNKILKSKVDFIENINLFLLNKNKFIFSIKSLKEFLNNRKIRSNYILFILKQLKKNYLFNKNSLFFIMFMKKKRYSFLPIFLWIYKVFDKISLNYWLIFLIFWLRSFIFFYLNIITYIFPPYKNIIRTSLYASRYFSNFSRNIIIEKKLCFNIYNKIINNFYILRSFSSILNYNYFQNLKFQHLREISFFQDTFSHWHMNINKFSKFINIHYNEYLYNHLPINYFSKVKYNIKYKKNINYLKKNIIDTELFFNFESYQKEKNMKNIIFSKMKNDNKINIYYHLETKVPFLNKNLVYPSYIYMSESDNVEINKEKQIELKMEQKIRMAKKLKMTKKLKDLSFINDLKLIISSEKLWKMLDARRKERKVMQKIKKYWKIKKKIKFFGYDNLKKNRADFSKKINTENKFLSLNQPSDEDSYDTYVIIPPIENEEKVQQKKKKKIKKLRREKISIKFLKRLLNTDKDVKPLKTKDNTKLQKGLKNIAKPMTPSEILASYVEKFTKIKFEMLNERDNKRNEKKNWNKFGKNKFNKFGKNKFNKFGKYFKNKRFNKFYKFNRFRRYNFFNNQKFSSFIKRTSIPKNSKLYRYIKYLIFSKHNKITKNNIFDKYKIFRTLDDKYKITKYGAADKFNSFYKIILLHRFYNRFTRLKKDHRFSKKNKFCNKYANTLNLKFCYAWNSVLQQYSKKFLLPTNFLTSKPFWSFRLVDALSRDAYKYRKTEGKILNSKVSFLKNDYFLDKFFSSFLNNSFLSSHYYSFFLYNTSSWHTMENYKSFYSFFTTKVEKMSDSMQLLVFKNFVLSRFFNSFWKSFYFLNLSIFLKKNIDKFSTKVYFWGILHFLRVNKNNYFHYILLNLNLRLLKYSRIKNENFFRKNILTKNKSFISKINRFILEINDLFFVKIKEIIYVRSKFIRIKRKPIFLILKILKLFSNKILKGLALLKLSKDSFNIIYLFYFIRFIFKKLQKKFIFFKRKFLLQFFLKQNKKKKVKQIKFLKTNIAKLRLKIKILKLKTIGYKLKIYKSLIKFYKYSLFFSIVKLKLNTWEFSLGADIDIDSLFFLEFLRKQARFLAIKKSKKIFKNDLYKKLSYSLKFFKGLSFLKKNKLSLENVKIFKHFIFVTLLTFYKNYIKKDLAILKFINKFQKRRLLYNLYLIFISNAFILEKKNKKGELNLYRAPVKNLFLFIKLFISLLKKFSFKNLRLIASREQNSSTSRKKILRFTLKKENYYYYKKMFRWRCFLTIDSYKLLGLRYFNGIKREHILKDRKVALKKRSLLRKKFNHKYLIVMKKSNFKKGRNLFSLYNFFFKYFSSKGAMLALNEKKLRGKAIEIPSFFNYWHIFSNKRLNVNFRNKVKLFNLKNKPLFFKLNNFIPKVIVKKNFSIFYKEGRKNLKKKKFFEGLHLRRVLLNKNTVYWFNYLKKQEFAFKRKKQKTWLDKLKKKIERRGSSSIFFSKFYKGHYLNFHKNFFFAPLQFNALKSLILKNL